MERLRGKNGCPWDKKQTPLSLKPYIIEEAYELVEAIDEGNPEKICEELGDLLFQIIFQAQIFSEQKKFDLALVIDRLHQKMLLRHPHIFGDKKCKTPEQVKKQWVELKRQSKPGNSVLGEVPKSLPALLRARRITDNASQVGFDWKKTQEVMNKVDEEWKELKSAINSKRKNKMAEELGDLLFVLVNLSRFLKLNPEECLNKTTRKFEERFHYIEAQAYRKGKDLKKMTLAEMDQLWEEAKKLSQKSKNNKSKSPPYLR